MPIVEGCLKRLEIIDSPEGDALRAQLWKVTRRLQEGFRELGLDIGPAEACVTPVHVEAGVHQASNIAVVLREEYHIFCSVVIYPVIPKGMVIFRIIPTAAHSMEDVERTLAAFKDIKERLATVASGCLDAGAKSVKVLPYDFNDCSGIDNLVDEAWNAVGKIDVVMLNAGISQRTSVEDTSMEMVRKIMEVNYFAPVSIAKAILPRMVAAGGGNIAVTTSIAGRFGFPLRCGYSSSKFALYGFFETLQAEYHDYGIKVTIICPGRVRTNISRYAGG